MVGLVERKVSTRKGRFPQSTHIPQLWRILDEDWNGELMLEIES